MGKLDATTTQPAGAAAAAPGGVAVVNGPEGEVLDWQRVDWRQVQDDVGEVDNRGAGKRREVRRIQREQHHTDEQAGFPIVPNASHHHTGRRPF